MKYVKIFTALFLFIVNINKCEAYEKKTTELPRHPRRISKEDKLKAKIFGEENIFSANSYLV